MAQAVDEAVAVARALRVNLACEAQAERVRQVCALTSANRASMLQDVLRGAPTEIDVINGAVVAKGREVGVPTPVNAAADPTDQGPGGYRLPSDRTLSVVPLPKETSCNRES